jgi:hypothetical protein
MGGQVCQNGVWGECMCFAQGDASIPDFGEAMPCPTDFTCQSLGGGGMGGGGMGGGAPMGAPSGFCVPAAMGGGGFALPPTCTTDDDCDAAGLTGVTCTSFMGFLSACVQNCEP